VNHLLDQAILGFIGVALIARAPAGTAAATAFATTPVGAITAERLGAAGRRTGGSSRCC